jgi:hypothetical protein
VGQFGYRVIDQSARRTEVCMSDVTRYYNLAERLYFTERDGSVRSSFTSTHRWNSRDIFDRSLGAFGYALWNDNLKENPTDGNLKEELVTGNWKGTGVFQKELNKGSLAVMSDDTQYAKDDIFIREQFRGRGIGMWALKQLFKHETLRVSNVSTQGNVSMLSLQLGSEVCLREPWATRVSQHENGREAANQGIQLFFRKVNCLPPQRLTSNC